MHFLIGLGIIIGLIAFAFGENAARHFVQGLFALVLCGVAWLAWDVYRDIPTKKPARYELMELEMFPKPHATRPNQGINFK